MRFEQPRLSAEHVRQIFYYAIHAGSPENTSALLVYAGTEEGHVVETWHDRGYEMGCVTLDLNREFAEIREQLNTLAALSRARAAAARGCSSADSCRRSSTDSYTSGDESRENRSRP